MRLGSFDAQPPLYHHGHQAQLKSASLLLSTVLKEGQAILADVVNNAQDLLEDVTSGFMPTSAGREEGGSREGDENQMAGREAAEHKREDRDVKVEEVLARLEKIAPLVGQSEKREEGEVEVEVAPDLEKRVVD